ncbi:hypothetical protein [Phaffia rhodozyma]|uniref:Uncharacterized protein n=1 Tax=Phaffia rhodozyma TaxID=264483 RepID=A0A0F7SQF1_PHARH|nr:hypothetical protein [Phaffia rhodozyma]
MYIERSRAMALYQQGQRPLSPLSAWSQTERLFLFCSYTNTRALSLYYSLDVPVLSETIPTRYSHGASSAQSSALLLGSR